MKSTKKRIIIVFAILTMALVLSCAFVACNKTESDKTGTDKDVCEHVEVTDNAVEPTCTEKGLTEGTHCSKCGKILQAQNEIPALGHKYGDIIPKTEPTCSENGVEAHYKCSVCNKVFKDDEHKTETTLDELTIAINPNAHNFGNWIKNEGADTHTRVCSYNSEHTETESCRGGTATCTKQAICERCDNKYGELAKHDYKNGVCIVCGNRRPSEGLEYSLNSDRKGYTVTGMGTCTDKELIIPSEYNAKPVTSIGYRAFYNYSSRRSVTIPDSVTSIGGYAFEDCTGLTTVNWNATACTSAGSLDYPIFKGCSNLATVNIGDNVKIIPSYAFFNCKGLENITIPDSVTSIGVRAFSDCTELWSVTIGNGVTSIGNGAFRSCTWLSSVRIGNSVTSIGEGAFSYCMVGLKNIKIPNSVTSIGDYAFYSCRELTSVTIPDSVTSIGEEAFSYCISLTSVTIGGSVTSIGSGAFDSCIGLKSIKFNGTKEQWNAISKGNGWKDDVPSTCKVICTDGEISIIYA